MLQKYLWQIEPNLHTRTRIPRTLDLHADSAGEQGEGIARLDALGDDDLEQLHGVVLDLLAGAGLFECRRRTDLDDRSGLGGIRHRHDELHSANCDGDALAGLHFLGQLDEILPPSLGVLGSGYPPHILRVGRDALILLLLGHRELQYLTRTHSIGTFQPHKGFSCQSCEHLSRHGVFGHLNPEGFHLRIVLVVGLDAGLLPPSLLLLLLLLALLPQLLGLLSVALFHQELGLVDKSLGRFFLYGFVVVIVVVVTIISIIFVVLAFGGRWFLIAITVVVIIIIIIAASARTPSSGDSTALGVGFSSSAALGSAGRLRLRSFAATARTSRLLLLVYHLFLSVRISTTASASATATFTTGHHPLLIHLALDPLIDLVRR